VEESIMSKAIVALVLPLMWAATGCASSADPETPAGGGSDGESASGGGSRDLVADGRRGREVPTVAPRGPLEEVAMERGAPVKYDPALSDRFVRGPGVIRPPGRPQPTEVASNLGNLGALTVADDTVLYVTNGEVRAVPREGVPLRPIGQRIPTQASVAADAKNVFHLDAEGAVVRTDRETGETSLVFGARNSAFALGRRGATLFWVDRDDIQGDRIFAGRPGDPASHVLATPAAKIRGTAFTNDHVYYTTDDGRVMRSSRVNGCAGASCTVEIARGESGPGSIAVNEGWVWWANNDGVLRSASLQDGQLEVVAIADGHVRNLVADARGVYFSVDTQAAGSWAGWSANGSRHAIGLASHRTGIDVMVADAAALYWTDRELGAVFRLAK